jgi:MFS family permease
LVPLSLFRDRNFSLSNAAIVTVGFAITAMAFPFMLFTQAVLGYSPTQSALLLVPMALLSGGLAPVVGRFVDTVHPRYITTGGLLLCSVSLFWVSRMMSPDVAAWQLLLPMALLGVANAGMWAPLATTATRNLPPQSAGAGAGIYNTTRQVGAVLGSAAVAAVIEARLAANLGAAGESMGGSSGAASGAAGAGLPPQIASGFASAMSEAMLLPSAVLLLGVVAVLFFVKQSAVGPTAETPGAVAAVDQSVLADTAPGGAPAP